jgi:hypothetical protein
LALGVGGCRRRQGLRRGIRLIGGGDVVHCQGVDRVMGSEGRLDARLRNGSDGFPVRHVRKKELRSGTEKA